MNRWKFYRKLYLTAGLLFCALTLFLSIETAPCQVMASSVFTSSGLTETDLTVVMHTLLPVRQEEIAREVIKKHRNINNPRGQAFYSLKLYRTGVHYHLHILYDTIRCDASGRLL
ncbi:hypothetical protein [uncultured Merdimonas sp.]|uniref:hypothetical protein n=1 Tax=uncultured Merdimonas sp. TaxID=2023269 RepID=UPI00320B3297